MPKNSKMLTAEQVAAEFGVCAKTVSRWDVNGLFPATTRTPGGHRRWARAAVEAKLREGVTAAAAA